MKKIALVLTGLAFVSFISCKNDTKKDEDGATPDEVVKEEVKEEVKSVSFGLEPKSGSKVVGKMQFTETNGTVSMEAYFEGLSPGMHAIHIHEKADCSAEDASSSGGHWNPTFAPHGKWGAAEGYHRGDIGNFEADAAGVGSITMQTDEWCLGCDDETKNVIGKAVIVHQGVDDFVTQPTGDAGGRVSCGGIIQ